MLISQTARVKLVFKRSHLTRIVAGPAALPIDSPSHPRTLLSFDSEPTPTEITPSPLRWDQGTGDRGEVMGCSPAACGRSSSGRFSAFFGQFPSSGPRPKSVQSGTVPRPPLDVVSTRPHRQGTATEWSLVVFSVLFVVLKFPVRGPSSPPPLRSLKSEHQGARKILKI